MAKHGKKYRKASEQVKRGESFSAQQALDKVKQLAFAKFDESVDIHVNLGIDAAKGEQVVRGSVVLPFSKGKAVKVLVFAKNEFADKALKAGADYVGSDDLIEKISGGWMDFDYAVATPDLMAMVGKVAKTLGPKGLLPNKKLGTVTFDVADVVQDLKRGRQFFKNDKSGLVHFTIGKVSFSPDQLYQNLTTFIKALMAAKPPVSKGKFLRKITLASTMGLGMAVNPDDLS
ncbi:MAG: 50S ribosomal protein L1 [Candidatus Dependentiae bacterium]|nr:50S ribosomal protein L1 [Candidatus Dependentiae bacterium]